MSKRQQRKPVIPKVDHRPRRRRGGVTSSLAKRLASVPSTWTLIERGRGNIGIARALQHAGLVELCGSWDYGFYWRRTPGDKFES